MNQNHVGTTAAPTAFATAEDARSRPVRPRVDVYENDGELLVVADLPGVTKEGIELTVEGRELTLRARREVTPERPLSAEYRLRDYARSFTLPEDLDVENIQAELSGGVLRVHLPKASARRARRIEVRSS